MDPKAHFGRNDVRGRRSTRLSQITGLLIASTSSQILGQSISVPIGDRCVELNQTAMTQIAAGMLKEAELALTEGLTSGTIFSRAKDAVAMDRIKLLNVRGVLQAWQGDWQSAELDLHEALTMADREPWVDPSTLRALLNNYAAVLRRNHHGREAARRRRSWTSPNCFPGSSGSRNSLFIGWRSGFSLARAASRNSDGSVHAGRRESFLRGGAFRRRRQIPVFDDVRYWFLDVPAVAVIFSMASICERTVAASSAFGSILRYALKRCEAASYSRCCTATRPSR